MVIAICDETLLGKRLRLSTGVSVEVQESFYKGVLVVDTDLEDYFKMGTIINLLGENAVKAAVKFGYATEKSVIYVDGVPHIQLFL